MANNRIEYVGIKELAESEKELVKRLAEEYFPKLQREAKNDIELIVYVKRYNKGGNRVKYSVHMKLIYAKNALKVDECADWELPVAMHMAYDAMLNLVKSHLRNGSSKYKERKSENKSERSIIRRAMEVFSSKKKSSVKRRTEKKRNSLF